MYWSLDHHQVGVTDHKINKSHYFWKRTVDQSLNLSLSRANEIRISIILSQAILPSSHMDLSQTGSMS
jgi:hypothetical protein